MTVTLAGHLFGLASPDDRWSDAAGRTLGQSDDNEDWLLGYEVDVNVTYAPRSWLKLAMGYALFVPTEGAESLGHPDPTHWAYLMVGSVLP